MPLPRNLLQQLVKTHGWGLWSSDPSEELRIIDWGKLFQFKIQFRGFPNPEISGLQKPSSLIPLITGTTYGGLGLKTRILCRIQNNQRWQLSTPDFGRADTQGSGQLLSTPN